MIKADIKEDLKVKEMISDLKDNNQEDIKKEVNQTQKRHNNKERKRL
jgi:hypothetical protein